MAIYYYTGLAGGAWNVGTNWTQAGSAGTTGLPTAADIAVLNNNGITIPSTTTGQIINVDKIMGLYPLQGSMITTATTLTGTGTFFLTELAIGTRVWKSDGTTLGTVQSVISNTSATVTGGASNATGVTAYGGGGASSSLTINITTSATYTIDAPNGIEGGQIATVSPTVINVAGTGGISTNVDFNSESGNIRGAGAGSGGNSAIKLSLSGSIININCINIYGGITASDNYGVAMIGNGNTINVTATGEILPGAAPALNIFSTTSIFNVSAALIKGGTSYPAILNTTNNTSTQIISAANITPSTTCSAISFINASAPYLNTTLANITASTAINTSGNGSNPITAITVMRYYLTTPLIKIYQNSSTENPYSVTSGTIPNKKYVLATIAVGSETGTLTLPQQSTVLAGTNYGVGELTSPAEQSTGTLDIPNAVAQVIGNIVANLT
jgi:hypothetical protein